MKKKSGLIVIIVILMLILLAGGAFAYVYFSTDLLRTDKEMFLKYFSQITTDGQFVDNSIKQYNEKKQQTPYENKGKITVEADVSEEFDVPVDNVNGLLIDFSGKTDKSKNIAEQNVEIVYDSEYDENGDYKVSLPFTYKQYEDTFGVQFDHFGNKYIAFRNENLKEFAQKFGIEDVSQIPDKIELSEVEEEIEFSTEETEQLKQIYGIILQEQLLDENFSRAKTDEGESYTLQLSGEQIKNIIIKMLEATKQNTLLIDKVNEYMLKMDPDTEEIEVEAIDELIQSINEEDFSEISDLKITLIQKNQELNQIILESGENKITIAKNKEAEMLGYKINIDIKQIDEENSGEFYAYFNMQYNGIETLENVGETFNLGFEIISEDETMAYEYDIINNIQFKESVSIDEFGENGDVFLNDHKPEVITNFITQVVTRLGDINRKQMEELGLKEYENPLLYSNPITMLAFSIYNIASETIENNMDLSDYEREQFNSKFEKYVSEDTAGVEVNAMIQTAFNHNLAQMDQTTTVKVTDDEGNVIVEATNEATSSPQKVSSANRYKIEAKYNEEQLITEMVISTQE